MKIASASWTSKQGWSAVEDQPHGTDLVLYFAAPEALKAGCLSQLRKLYPDAHFLGCSTGGEILGADVLDECAVMTALSLKSTRLRRAERRLAKPEQSEEVGRLLAQDLAAPDLHAVFVLSDGLLVNGSALVRGMRSALPAKVVITGGLAGDGPRFGSTCVGSDGEPEAGLVAAVGFCGDSIQVGHGSVGGWETFGPERLVTRADGNVLYELDGQPALTLYKKYLGPEADALPGSALLFPLSIRRQGDTQFDLVRTIVGIDEKAQSMTFAGDVPQGAIAQLMRGSFDRLIEGAGQAATESMLEPTSGDTLAVLVSCIGRKLLMGQRIADEVEAVADALGTRCTQVGFYSYGEISPHHASGVCDLHNQTMTVTTFSER